jgi:hypothetical protein
MDPHDTPRKRHSRGKSLQNAQSRSLQEIWLFHWGECVKGRHKISEAFTCAIVFRLVRLFDLSAECFSGKQLGNEEQALAQLLLNRVNRNLDSACLTRIVTD